MSLCREECSLDDWTTHLVDVHVPRDGVARGRSQTWESVDDTCWDTCFFGEVTESQGGERGEFGGLHDDTATCSERGGDLHPQRLLPSGETPGLTFQAHMRSG